MRSIDIIDAVDSELPSAKWVRWVGVIDDRGHCQMSKEDGAFHSNFGWESYHWKWSYWPKLERLSWWHQPDADTAQRVVDFLLKQGFKVTYFTSHSGLEMKIPDGVMLESFARSVIDQVVESRQSLFSWMSPSGKIFPVEITHYKSALDLVGRVLGYNESAWDIMFRKGWVRVSYVGEIIFANNDVKPALNDTQLRVLKDLAIEHHMEAIYYDHNNSNHVGNPMGSKAVWSADDQL